MAALHEMQAQRIAAVLEAAKIVNTVESVDVRPRRFVRFTVRIGLGAKVSKIEALADELALALGAPTVLVQRQGGAILVDVPRDGAPQTLDLPTAFRELQSTPAMTAVLGEDVSGAPLLLKLDAPDVAHLLIAGTTGSGKSELLRVILLTLALHNAPGQMQIALLDTKGQRSKLQPLAALPHCWAGLPVVGSGPDALQVLTALVLEMERRDRARASLPQLVIAIDELADLTAQQPEAVALLQRLTQRGREAGLHVIAATQRPSADAVSGDVKANFVRIVGKVQSTDDAKVAAGVGGTGAERLLGRGDFIVLVNGETLRFQAAYASDSEAAQLVRAINEARHHKRRTWRAEQVRAALNGAGQSRSGAGPARRPRTVAQALTILSGWVGGVGGDSAAPEIAPAGQNAGETAHPPTHPPAPLALLAATTRTARRPTLADRFPPPLLYQAYLAQGKNRKAACAATFGYADSSTLALMNAAIALHESNTPEVIQ